MNINKLINNIEYKNKFYNYLKETELVKFLAFMNIPFCNLEDFQIYKTVFNKNTDSTNFYQYYIRLANIVSTTSNKINDNILYCLPIDNNKIESTIAFSYMPLFVKKYHNNIYNVKSAINPISKNDINFNNNLKEKNEIYFKLIPVEYDYITLYRNITNESCTAC